MPSMTEKEKLDAIVEAMPKEQRDNLALNAHIKCPNDEWIQKSKLKNPPTYIQLTEGGNITYNVKIVDKWYENYIITRRGRRK